MLGVQEGSFRSFRFSISFDNLLLLLIVSYIRCLGEAFGVSFCHERPIITNTIASHVLVQYAKRYGLHNRVAEVLMRTYCEEGPKIFHLALLCANEPFSYCFLVFRC